MFAEYQGGLVRQSSGSRLQQIGQDFIAYQFCLVGPLQDVRMRRKTADGHAIDEQRRVWDMEKSG